VFRVWCLFYRSSECGAALSRSRSSLAAGTIVVTAHGDEAMRFKALMAGTLETLPRPFDDKFLSRVFGQLSAVESRRKVHDEQEVYRGDNPKSL
jgi:FixJ family two-component response regulator